MQKERLYSPGENIGPYRVERVLALGSAAAIYEATPHPQLRADLRARGIHRVALKLPRVELLPQDRQEHRRMVERLERELRTLVELTRMGHPNIVEVYDYGWEGGVPYYAMERVEGVTLAEALGQRPRVGQVLHAFAKLCGAVVLLHERGICHRDLKPGNVMLRASGGEPVLIDFGLCLPPTGRALTEPQRLLGTPDYLSPEYAAHWLAGKEAQRYLAAPTDDVWALGVMLYEVLTGAVPWRTEPDRPESLLKEIRKGRPRHPSEVYGLAPRAVGDVVMGMLVRDPRKRLRNAEEVLLRLGTAAEGADILSPVAPRRARGPGAKAPRWGRERGHAAGLLALAVGGVSAIFVLVSLSNDEGEPSRRDAGASSAARGQVATDPQVSAPGDAPGFGPPELEGAAEQPRELPLVLEGLPPPAGPYKGQLRPPCPRPYQELSRGCWKEFFTETEDGKRGPCPDNVVEVQGKEGPRCFIPVYPRRPSTVKPLDGGQ